MLLIFNRLIRFLHHVTVVDKRPFDHPAPKDDDNKSAQKPSQTQKNSEIAGSNRIQCTK